MLSRVYCGVLGRSGVFVMSEWCYSVSSLTTLNLVATFRVARLTSQTRKLWLVGLCRDRPSRAFDLHQCRQPLV